MSALSRVLPDFSDNGVVKVATPASLFGHLRTVRIHAGGQAKSGSEGQPTAAVAAVPDVKPKPTPAELQAEAVQVAVDRARDEEREIACRDLEVALRDQIEKSAEAMIEQRDIWVREQAEVLSGQIARCFGALETRLSGKIANILKPVMLDAFRQEVIDEAINALQSLLSNSQSAVIQVSGPEDLIAAIRERLDGPVSSVDFVVNENPDVSIIANETIITTRLDAWARQLAAIQTVD